MERVNHALMFGTMSAELRQILLTATRAIPATNASSLTSRAQGALYLAAISSEYSVFATSGGPGSTPGPGPGAPGAPAAPRNLAGFANGSSLALTWRNSAEGAAATSLMLDVTGAVTVSVPLALTESFSYAGVPNGTFTFSVRAVNAAGPSAASNAVTLTFPGSGAGSGPGPGCAGAAGASRLHGVAHGERRVAVVASAFRRRNQLCRDRERFGGCQHPHDSARAIRDGPRRDVCHQRECRQRLWNGPCRAVTHRHGSVNFQSAQRVKSSWVIHTLLNGVTS